MTSEFFDAIRLSRSQVQNTSTDTETKWITWLSWLSWTHTS